MSERTPYEVLGVEPGATAAEIKKAYRRRSSEAHPDREGGDALEMQAINEAYALLSDPARRRKYDETGDTDKEGSLTEVARGLLCNELTKILDAESWNDPMVAMKAAIDAIQAQAITSYATHVERLKTLRNRSRSFAAKEGAEDFLRPVFTRRIEEAQEALKACEKLNDAAKLARQILEGYRFENFLLAQANWQRYGA